MTSRSWGWIALGASACGAAGGGGGGGTAPRAKTTSPVVIADHRLHPAHLAADASGAYWTEPVPAIGEGPDGTNVVAAARPGEAPRIVFHRAGRVSALAPYGPSLYFVGSRDDGTVEVRRIAKSGGTDELVASDVGQAVLAIDASGLYFITGDGQVAKVGFAPHAAPVVLARSVEYSYADGLALDATGVYFTNELDDTPRRVYRVAKSGGEVSRADRLPGPAVTPAWGDDVVESVFADGAFWLVRDDRNGDAATGAVLMYVP